MSAHPEAGRYDNAIDERREFSPAQQARIDERAREIGKDKLDDAEWWRDELNGINEASNAVPDLMPVVCGRNLDNACNGDLLAVQAILTALSGFQKIVAACVALEAQIEAEE